MRENVELHGETGRLAAHLYLPQGTPPFPAVVLCHGITSCKDNCTDMAEFLQGEGFAVLASNCRRHGESEGALDGDAWRDVGTVLDYLQAPSEVDAEGIALVGSSMGAHNGLRAAAEYPALRALATFNTVPSAVLRQGLLNADYWHWIHMGGGHVNVALPGYLLYLEENDVFGLPARIQCPIFLIRARDDEFVPYTVSEKLYTSASESRRL